MFVITADQVNSRGELDRAPAALAMLEDLDSSFATEADRNAGDEIQIVTESAETALEVLLRLSRTEQWSVGVGVGAVRLPLPRMAREASGAAFIEAREAVAAAKRRPTRFALRAGSDSLNGGAHAMALVELLISLRDRRSAEGWEVCDLLATGINQAEAAESLGITPQAVSLRLRIAGWRIEQDARPALAVVLESLERSSGTENADDDH